MRILIAEDDRTSRRVLEGFLIKWGHEVVSAQDGAEAWKLFQAGDYSIVISDWMMPELDGLELVKRIRGMPRTGYVYIILLTAKSQKEDLILGMESGADDFLAKPFDRDELRVRLGAGKRILDLEQALARRNEELEAINAEVENANLKMKNDLLAAAKLQVALLPPPVGEFGTARSAWAFKPCESLAGDFLNFFRLDEHHVGFYVLDVSGHGVQAALLSVTLSHLLSPTAPEASLVKQQISRPPGYQIVGPLELAMQLNKRFPIDPETAQYFTLLYGLLNLETCEFRYCSAGHPCLAYLAPGQSARHLSETGPGIGLMKEAVHKEYTLPMETGSRVYIYSDGVSEATNANHQEFDHGRVLQTIEGCRQMTLRESVITLLNKVEKWHGGQSLADDVSVLGIELGSPTGEPPCEEFEIEIVQEENQEGTRSERS